MNTLQKARPSLPPILAQLIRYGAVGASNTLIGFGVYALCVDLFAIQYEISLTIAYVVGALNGYLLNRRWTFKANDVDHASSTWRYAAVQTAAFLTNLALLHAAVAWLAVEKLIAQAVIFPIVFLLTFIPNRLWSFAHRPRPIAPATPGPSAR